MLPQTWLLLFVFELSTARGSHVWPSLFSGPLSQIYFLHTQFPNLWALWEASEMCLAVPFFILKSRNVTWQESQLPLKSFHDEILGTSVLNVPALPCSLSCPFSTRPQAASLRIATVRARKQFPCPVKGEKFKRPMEYPLCGLFLSIKSDVCQEFINAWGNASATL